MSREGLYVSATRGREAIRVFVPDRAAFLDVAELKHEVRMSALEFERQRITGMDVQSVPPRFSVNDLKGRLITLQEQRQLDYGWEFADERMAVGWRLGAGGAERSAG